MLTPSCDLLPSTSFSSLIIDFAYQQQHLIPLEPGMSDAEALTLADFGFPDEEAVQQAEDAWFVGRQVEETKCAPRNAKLNSVSEAVDVGLTAKTSGEKSAAGSGYGYSAFRAANPDSDGKKKKGRPVGWRKGLHMKPKTEVSNKPPPTTAAISKLPETKNEDKKQVKIEAPRTPAPDPSLSSDSDIQKADVNFSHSSPTPASTGYAAFRLANPGTKKVGRPVGWKMGAHAKRKRIEKEKSRKKSSKKLTHCKDGSKVLALIEMKEKPKGPFFDHADGEGSMQLGHQQNAAKSSLQLDSPTYHSVHEKQESMELDEDSQLPASFWEGVLAAAITATSIIDSSASEVIIDAEPSTESEKGRTRRDSAHDTIASCFPSLETADQAALPNSSDETNQDDESGSSDMSHFSA